VQLWRYNKITGYWHPVRSVTPETAEQWLQIWRRDDPSGIYVVSAKKPKPPRAKDSVLSIGALLAALLAWYERQTAQENVERNQVAHYDLTQYQPRPRAFDKRQ
jgi:hypothetical protein